MSTVMKVVMHMPLMGGLPGTTIDYSFKHIVSKEDAKLCSAYSNGWDEGNAEASDG